jgi:site-specific recombinase XerD
MVTSDCVTVRGYYQRVAQLCPLRSLPTYASGYRRLITAYGPSPLTEVTLADLTLLREQTRREVGARVVTEARRRERPLLSYDIDAHGAGAAENLVRAVRHYFRCAVDDGLLERSPADRLSAPPRPPAPERALLEAELLDIFRIASTTGNDPELDRLIVTTARETAARREGLLNLTLSGLAVDRAAVTLSEKQGRIRRLPLRRALLAELDEFAHRRGARAAGDAVLRYNDGRPLTRRRFNTLFDRIDRQSSWTTELAVGIHWLRHTTLTDIAAVAGQRVATAYAGHSPNGKDTILRYTTVTFEELAAAYEAIFGPR